MSTIQTGKKIPAFKAPATGDKTIKSADLKDHNAVIYFYPKDNTPGCTV
ncbi:MAG TPA: redoxin domain-containing protein, partial [Gammaproteobacteria bacterium]|nr:redoxin domain-containing protein [Gammaproteobacteria bacterium]